MWIPKKLLTWLEMSKDQRDELISIRAERDVLKDRVIRAEANFNWLSTRVNALELERAQLIKLALNINVPVPEIVRTPTLGSQFDLNPNLFDDVGDEMAKSLGLPLYDKN